LFCQDCCHETHIALIAFPRKSSDIARVQKPLSADYAKRHSKNCRGEARNPRLERMDTRSSPRSRRKKFRPMAKSRFTLLFSRPEKMGAHIQFRRLLSSWFDELERRSKMPLWLLIQNWAISKLLLCQHLRPLRLTAVQGQIVPRSRKQSGRSFD